MRCIEELGASGCSYHHITSAIIDSSFYTTRTVSQTVLGGYFADRLRGTWLRTPAYFFGCAFARVCIRPFFKDTSVNYHSYGACGVPTLFLHGQHDPMAQWNDMAPFVQSLKNAGFPVAVWLWEDEQRHALNHVKHGADYHKILYDWIQERGCTNTTHLEYELHKRSQIVRFSSMQAASQTT
jgi:pimeloyl-ACP methyl ester carboxylesterase